MNTRNDGVLRIGVVGFSAQCFDEEQAHKSMATFFDVLPKEVYDRIEIVSGYTAMGVPLVAYEEAINVGFDTVGIACAKADDYDCYPCDKVIIEGENWGDESETFLNYIDMLVKFGGGEQSKAEFEAYEGAKLDFALEKTDESD